MDNVLELLNNIEKFKNNFGDSIYSKPNQDDLLICLSWMKKNGANESFINDYLNLMSLINGMEFNGLIIYSTIQNDNDSIYESNEVWWDIEEQRKYIFFADDSISWFCFSKLKNKYYILDKGSGDLIEEFDTFNNIIYQALNNVID